jgi:hypothetical protein
MLDDISDLAEELATRMTGAELAAELEGRGRALEPGAAGRAAWLSLAGERWEMAGNLARARWCFEDAARDGGSCYVDPRAELVDVYLRLGEASLADQLLVELLRDVAAGRTHGPVHDFVGESLEQHGRFEEALRWFNAGLTRALREGADDAEIDCLNGRFRVRRRLELPHDRYDELCARRRRDNAADLESRPGGGPGPRAAQPRALVVLYWPPDDFARAVAHWPAMAEEYGAEHAGHRARVEETLRGLAAEGASVSVGVCALEDFRAFAEQRGDRTAQPSTRAGYAAHPGCWAGRSAGRRAGTSPAGAGPAPSTRSAAARSASSRRRAQRR